MDRGSLTLRQRLEHRAARLLLSLPPKQQLLLCGGSPVQRDGLTLHPEMQLLLALRALLGAPSLGQHPPELGRVHLRTEALVHYGERIEVGARDLEVGGAAGALKARHYAPDLPGSAPRPLLVFFHGGGFVLGDLDTHDSLCRLLCRHAEVHVLAVEYRLAPEHPFPAGLEDARAAFRWALAHAEELGADPARVAVGGDSAGGNLAAVVSQLAVRDGETAPAVQLLIYPVTDRSVDRPSLSLFADGFFLTRTDIETFQRHYGADVTDPRVSPLLSSELGKLPPALVVTAGFDPLRDEGEAYAGALRAAGTPVVLRRFFGLIHGFANMVGVSRVARDAVVEVAGSLRAMLETATGDGAGRNAA